DGVGLDGQAAADQPSGMPAELPVRRLNLADARIALATPGGELVVPIEGSLETRGLVRLDAELPGTGDPQLPGLTGSLHLAWAAGTPWTGQWPAGRAELTA